jgi:hypothetical protein
VVPLVPEARIQEAVQVAMAVQVVVPPHHHHHHHHHPRQEH